VSRTSVPLVAESPAAGIRPPATLPVPLRPMTLSDQLDGAFRVIKSRPRTVFGIAGAILVPLYLVGAFLQRDSLRSTAFGTNLVSSGGVFRFSGSTLAGLFGAAALEAAGLFFLGGALARLVTSWYAGGDTSAGQALGAAFRRAPALLAAFVMLLPLKAIAYVLEYLPALLPVTLFALTAPAIVVEGLGPYAGARRSWRLVTRRFWPCVLTILCATVGASLLSFILGVIPELLAELLPDPWRWLVLGLCRAAVAMVVTTALTSVSVLLYIDQRIRTEGLDIELEAADAFAHVG